MSDIDDVVIEALRKLDPKNNAHWNKNGEPNMAAVEAIIGDSTVTRVQVTKAAPEFIRENLKLPEEITPEQLALEAGKKAAALEVEEAAQQKLAEEKAAIAREVEAKEAEDKKVADEAAAVEAVKEEKSIHEQICDCQNEISGLEKKKEIIQKLIDEEYRHQDRLVRTIPSSTAQDSQIAISGHLQRQKENAQKGVRSRLDLSMAPNKGPNARPNFTPQK